MAQVEHDAVLAVPDHVRAPRRLRLRRRFVELDLGQPRTVQFVGFRSRKMTDGTSIVRKFELRVDGQTTLGPFETPDPDIRYVIELPSPMTMQQVRMSAVDTSGGNTGLKELQLFAP